MSQAGSLGGGGSGGSGIQTINLDMGSITGSTVTLATNQAGNNNGATAYFEALGSDYARLTLSESGSGNTNIGYLSGAVGNTSTGCTSFGSFSLGNLNSGTGHSAFGSNSLAFLNGGSNCTAVGLSAGSNYTSTESNNITIGANVVGVIGESNTTRIGTGQTRAFMAGAFGVTVTGSALLCSSTGQLGTVVSSERYKDNIVDIPDDVSVLDLRPVKFNYKSDETKSEQYGLIAEEVEKDFPYLCLYKDELPETVKYHELPVFLLKEIQKLNDRVKALEGKNATEKKL